MQLRPGDRIVVKLWQKKVTNPYSEEYDETMILDIIAIDAFGYLVFVPPYTYLKETIRVDKSLLRSLKMHPKYLGDEVLHIHEIMILRIASQMKGCKCLNCQDFSWGAEPNQPDGEFLCYLCRDNPYR
jgi:hypothetical protein